MPGQSFARWLFQVVDYQFSERTVADRRVRGGRRGLGFASWLSVLLLTAGCTGDVKEDGRLRSVADPAEPRTPTAEQGRIQAEPEANVGGAGHASDAPGGSWPSASGAGASDDGLGAGHDAAPASPPDNSVEVGDPVVGVPDAGSYDAGSYDAGSDGDAGVNDGEGGPNADMITAIPQGLPAVVGRRSSVNDLYAVTQYLYLAEYDVHVFGTENVSEWMLLGTYEMARGMISSLKRAADRDQFRNHHFFVITNDDPDVPGGTTGHKNTGNEAYTVVTQELVCATATGTLRPNAPPKWRAWNTPVHEFGHAIELALGLRQTTVQLYSNHPGFNPDVQSEYFAWTSQHWFDAEIERPAPDFRQQMPSYKREYFASIFVESDIWRPSCEQALGTPIRR